jgi:tRNA1(Val) A37 N6-methylase TrmN6
MLNLDAFQNNKIPHQPLPRAAYDAARASLLKLDFPENAILDDYSFSTKQHSFTTNALAFAHSVHRNPAEYAGFTLYNATNQLSDEEIVSILTASGAFFHLIHRDNQYSFWISTFRNGKLEPHRVEFDIAYEQLDEVLGHYEADIRPKKIIDVKQGRDTFTLPFFRDIHPLQLSFWAADVTRDLLVEHFGRAVEVLRKHARQRQDTRAHDLPVTSLAVQLLGAIILADTGVLGDDIRLKNITLDQLIKKAHAEFDTYFQPELIVQYREAAEDAYTVLRLVRYAAFVPDMLSEIYLRAYSDEQRKQLGRYDTPLYLTRRIWENIPVEYLPPDQRYIADMTCGWGSFLIAGHERLTHLSDSPSSLREYLRGNDIDSFTARLAGLGLLLSTSKDSWKIDHEDALEWDWLDTHQPNIIIGNPPFEGHRGRNKIERSLKSKRQQKADAYLWQAIEHLAPGGYLAMVMPRSFTAAEASSKLRTNLLKYCDIFEIWQLPKVFTDVNPQAIVVFAQKKVDNVEVHYPVRVRAIHKVTHKYFQNAGIFTASQVVTNQSKWNETLYKLEGSENTHIMEYQVILSSQIWQKILEQSIQLNLQGDIFRGATVGSRRRYASYSNSKQVLWLSNVKKVLKQSFYIDYEYPPQTKLYPNDFEEPRLTRQHIFEESKVLVVHSPDPSWGKRAKVAIERNGYYVSGSFWVVSPMPNADQAFVTNEVLAAVISWDISNAWLIEHMTSLGIPEYAMNTIPFPKNLSADDCGALTKAVLQLEAAAQANQPEPEGATQTIDTILKRAYHLDDATFERLRKVMEWDKSPIITLDSQPDPDKADWFLSGVVDSVNAEQGTITMWLEGFGELQTVQIVPSMPGWILRPGVAFRTKIPEDFVEEGRIDKENIHWGIFRPQPYTYLSQEELFERLANLLHADGSSRIG